ncbi:hypothetical protein [Lysobacter claricitrinus]|uniref:hypothetical protein n=1 Tax=Lysobacter claricitrinus TaxID=3367728 RepID=UPI0037DBEB7B
MFEVEIWIDVTEKSDGVLKHVCTLFGRHSLPIRPMSGESFSYFAEKGAVYAFNLCSPIGPVPSNCIRVGIDEVSHYAVKTESGLRYMTSVRCEEIAVPSLDDAKRACTFMIEQADFEIDPYGLNRLTDEA